MGDKEPRRYLHVPARQIPAPMSISPEARAALDRYLEKPDDPQPELDDIAGWRARARAIDEQMQPFMQLMAPDNSSVSAEQIVMGGASGFLLKPVWLTGKPRILLDIHGGGLIACGGELCRVMSSLAAASLEALTYSVDYRMPPDHPYPAALDDCMAAYRHVLERHAPEEVIVRGGSAGANLAAALVLRARDEGLPLPAGVVLATPELDLTESGDSFRTNEYIDVVLQHPLMPTNLLYAAGHDLSHPYLSPLFGDFSKGFPPTILTTGTRDLFLSNAVRMHNALRRSGNRSELIIEEAMPHGGFYPSPEDGLMAADIRRFCDGIWAGD